MPSEKNGGGYGINVSENFRTLTKPLPVNGYRLTRRDTLFIGFIMILDMKLMYYCLISA